MKKTVVMLLIIACLMLLPSCKKPNEGQEFIPVDKEITVMTFNIRTIGLEDAPHKYWNNRKELVVQTVKDKIPDLIGFQELKKPQYDYIMEALGDAYGTYGLNCMGDTIVAEMLGGYNAVFYKKERFTFISSYTQWLSETPDTPSKGWGADSFRTFTSITLKDNLNNKEITFINTHFAYDSQTAMSESSRIISETAAKSATPVIVCGDFNYQQDTAYYTSVTSGILADSKIVAADSDNGGTFHAFSGTPVWEKPIDFILINKTAFGAASYKIVRKCDEDGHYPSDHFPLLVSVVYK